eukprot:CAMPEP_0201717044 /NCGR_PEP_ID=MMETSP0593-20130828/2883_1 /ASSEMBLY_ACC=CAM_ASM_000672 /TAXON_ID=267983 /ORGANISM="Skeletonema japonicum, Strain CCMP2506" /LENGTH=221 /DNA_ID=CAMNT_0048207007 /DNA_START=12 /DNA_END=677 /DNA_ORIENTATION=-
MMFHRSAARALTLSAAVLLATTSSSSNAFLAAAPSRPIRRSQHDDNIILMAAVTPPVATVASSAPTTPSTIASVSNLPSQKELLDKSSSSTSSATASSSSPVSKSKSTPQGGITISSINYDGQVPKTESDEYVTITNNSKTPMDISKYYVYVATTGNQGPTFTFPKSTTIKAGESVKIYTNEIHKESGGYSFGSGKAIWSNKGGLAVLKDGAGKKIGEFKY